MYRLTDKTLRQKTIPFDFENADIDPKELYENMADTMIKNKGMGLSANQVGFNYRMFVFGNPGARESIVGIFNPLIVDYSSGLCIMEEGCLSYPGLFVKIKRPEEIRVRVTDWQRNIDTFKLTGVSARIFQHEFDHMEGITFHSRASKLHLDQAKTQKKKLDRLRRKNAKRTSV